MPSIDCRPSAQDLSQGLFFYLFLKPDCGGTLPPCCLLGMDLQRQSSVFVSGRLSAALDVSTSPSAGRTSLSSPTTGSRWTRRPLLCLRLCAAAAATMTRRAMTMTDPPRRRRRWNIPLSPWRGDSPVHLGPLIDFPWRTPPFGSAASQWPRQWPHHRVAAPLQWEPSRGWAGPTGSSPRNTRPRLPAAACTGGAPPGTAALSSSVFLSVLSAVAEGSSVRLPCTVGWVDDLHLFQVKTGRWMQPEWLAWADVF